MTVESVCQEIANSDCDCCPLYEKRERIVVWRGNPSSKIVFAGEGPGKFEEQKGIPFVGPAGKKLDEMLTSIQINSNEHLFLTNSIMCRPRTGPGDRRENRQPTKEEILACAPNLKKVIETLQPELIVASGLVAARAIFSYPLKSLGEVVGQFYPPSAHIFDVDADLFVIYHPSYILRNPAKETEFLLQAIRFRDYARGRGIL